MILADNEILALCEELEGTLPLIAPLDPKSVGPASVDLRTGRKFSSPAALHAFVVRDGIRTREVSSTLIDGDAICRPGEGIEVLLEPGQVVACHSVEHVNLHPTMIGQLYIRSSYAREWITHSTAQLIHPGFSGTITFELSNTGPRPFSLRSGDRILQVIFNSLSSTPSAHYGQRGESKYQNQRAELRSLRIADEVAA